MKRLWIAATIVSVAISAVLAAIMLWPSSNSVNTAATVPTVTPTANCLWATDEVDRWMNVMRSRRITTIPLDDAILRATHLYELRDKACSR